MKVSAAPNVLIGAMLLLLLCLISGRPQVFPDTKSYYALGREAAMVFDHGRNTDASAEVLRGRQLTPTEAASETRLAYTVSASRSPYWSTLFYLAVELGSAWLVVALQALVAAAVVWIAATAFGVRQAYLPIVAVLALLSSLPVQVMLLMPDLFAGLAILCALVLLVARAQLTRSAAVILWGVMAASVLFHTSHLLTIVVLGGGALLIGLLRRSAWLIRPAAGMLAVGAIGAAGAVAFPLGVEAVRGERIYAPPFLSARLIADGPGRELLRRDCVQGDEWGWCAYLDQPLKDVNTILWDDRPDWASFQAADYARRVRMIDEQPRFVLEIVRTYPGAVAMNIADNIVRLFFQYGTSEVLDDPTARYRDPSFAAFGRIVPGTQDCVAGRASCASRLDHLIMDALIGGSLLLSCAVIAGVLASSLGRQRWSPTVLFVAAALLVNAIVCGGISGNAERYQSRITWLVPLVALTIIAEWFARRAASRGTAAAAMR